MSFELRPTVSPRIFILARERDVLLIATLAFDPEMSADQRAEWQRFILAKLNAGDVLAGIAWPAVQP